MVYLGSSRHIDLPSGSVDAVVTDPPFGDSVNYDHLADFFHAWHRVLYPELPEATSSQDQVQDSSPGGFSENFGAVLRECSRVLVPGGVAAYTFTHSNPSMWVALARAAALGGLRIVRSHLVLTDAAFSAISYRNSDRPQTNAVLVLRRSSELPEPARLEVGALLEQVVAEASSQVREVSGVGMLGRGDAVNAVLGCLVARIAQLPEEGWEAAAERAKVLAQGMPCPASPPKNREGEGAQLTLFSRHSA